MVALPHQKGLSLVELMITLALGSVLVLGISRYAIDALQSQETVAQQADIQDAARIAMEKIRTEVQRGGYLGCNDATRHVNSNITGLWADRIDQLEVGVEVSNGVLTTANLVPLFDENVPLAISPNRQDISIVQPSNVAFPDRPNAGTNMLFIGNCLAMDLINPPAINSGATDFSLQTPVSAELVNADTGVLLPGVKLYEYRESSIQLAANTFGNDGIPSISVNGAAFVSDLESNGLVINETATDSRIFDISLNFLDELRNDADGPAPAGQVEPGLYTSRVIARNAGGE